MAEVLDANETLTSIADVYNVHTLADVMYLHSAIQKGECIEVHPPTDSRILDVVGGLPCAKYWRRFITEVDEPTA